jgi:2-isopropylmalate synthase
MKKIAVADMTLRVLAEEKKTLTFREKLNIASSLDACGITAVELPAIGDTAENEVIYRTIATSIKNAKVCIDGGNTPESIEASYNCIKDAVSPCIQIVMPVSTVQMEYTYHLKAAAMLSKIGELISAAKKMGADVEFVAVDASRADEGFIEECAKVVFENGASAITVCDNAGVYFPEDYSDIVNKIKAAAEIKVYVAPSDTLKFAAASAIAAIKAGADGIKTAISENYLNADTLSDIFKVKGADMGATSSLDFTVIKNIISSLKSGVSVEVNETKTASLEAIDSSATIADIAEDTKKLGYELSDEDIGKVYEEAKRVIEKKGKIGASELEAVIASASMQVPSTFHVVSYVVNSGNIITATANLTLEKNGEKISGVATGDGPIDAAFHAIEQIVGHHYELDDFQIQSITKGREAVGSSLIRLRAKGKLYSGTGVSTDIVGASIRAYINALNKIVYEEN